VAFGVVFYGAEQPHAYRYRLGAMQVFEGANGVVIFAEVDLETHRPGLVRSPGTVHEPVRLYRIDVGHDGSVTRLRLSPPAGKTFFLGFEPISSSRTEIGSSRDVRTLGHRRPRRAVWQT
jgi:hypothetical protein